MSTTTDADTDAVNPSHYDGDACMRAIEIDGHGLHFCLATAKKYLWRVGRKHANVREDIGKANWYLDRAISYYDDDGVEYGAKISREVFSYIPDGEGGASRVGVVDSDFIRIRSLQALADEVLEAFELGDELPDLRPRLSAPHP